MHTRNDCDPEGQRLPIKLDSTTNGEFAPIPLDASLRHANALAAEWAQRASRNGSNQSRRELPGLRLRRSFHAARLQCRACARRARRRILRDLRTMPRSTAARRGRARQEGIHLRRAGSLRESDRRVDCRRCRPGAKPLADMPNAQCELAKTPGERSYLQVASSGDEFIKDVFLDSDTDIMVLSFVPSTREGEPLTIEEALATRDIVEKMEGTQAADAARPRQSQPEGRRRGHGAAREIRRRRVQDLHAVGPGRQGLLHDRRRRHRVRASARARLGVRNICIHKGLPFGPKSYEHSTCARHRPDRQALSRT